MGGGPRCDACGPSRVGAQIRRTTLGEIPSGELLFGVAHAGSQFLSWRVRRYSSSRAAAWFTLIQRALFACCDAGSLSRRKSLPFGELRLDNGVLGCTFSSFFPACNPRRDPWHFRFVVNSHQGDFSCDRLFL